MFGYTHIIHGKIQTPEYIDKQISLLVSQYTSHDIWKSPFSIFFGPVFCYSVTTRVNQPVQLLGIVCENRYVLNKLGQFRHLHLTALLTELHPTGLCQIQTHDHKPQFGRRHHCIGVYSGARLFIACNWYYTFIYEYIYGLVQDCINSITNALELLQSCTKPSI